MWFFFIKKKKKKFDTVGLIFLENKFVMHSKTKEIRDFAVFRIHPQDANRVMIKLFF